MRCSQLAACCGRLACWWFYAAAGQGGCMRCTQLPTCLGQAGMLQQLGRAVGCMQQLGVVGLPPAGIRLAYGWVHAAAGESCC
jgi:hypothetical protein